MKQTITVNGKKYAGKQIADLMDKSNITNDLGDKFIKLGGDEFMCQYRHDDHDGYYAPQVGSRSRANCIVVECRDYYRKEWVLL